MQELSLVAIVLGIVFAVITDRKPSQDNSNSQQPTISQVVNIDRQPQPKNITINVYESEEKRDD